MGFRVRRKTVPGPSSPTPHCAAVLPSNGTIASMNDPNERQTVDWEELDKKRL